MTFRLLSLQRGAMRYSRWLVAVLFCTLAWYPFLPSFISYRASHPSHAHDIALRSALGRKSRTSLPTPVTRRLPPKQSTNQWFDRDSSHFTSAVASFGFTFAILQKRYRARLKSSRFGQQRSSVICRAQGGNESYYDILNVNQTASEKEIKSSFRKLAREWHPDVNKDLGAQEKFQKIASAYEVLRDPQKRRNYDMFGEEAVGGPRGGGPDFSSMNVDDLGDMFGQFFRRGGRRQRSRGPQRGSDLRSQLRLSFEEACFGCNRVVRVQRQKTCASCSGIGRKNGAGNSSCDSCGGSGMVIRTVQSPLGVMQTQQECSSCYGTGIDPSEICQSCNGQGTTSESVEVSVKVPAGCSQGLQLCLRGEGNNGRLNGPAGDLYVALRVDDSLDFVREGFNIFTECEVSAYDAILGATVSVKTLDGELDIAVPPGTQPDTRLRLRQKGVPKLGRTGDRGDHYVIVKVKVPTAKAEEEQQWLRNLRQGSDSVLGMADTV